jgi:hypothetical protein
MGPKRYDLPTVPCTCQVPAFWGHKRLCRNCGCYEEVVTVVKSVPEVPDVPEEFLQFGDVFTKHLRKRGPCVLYVMGSRTAPEFHGRPVRRMFVDVPEGWHIRPQCGEYFCIEPEHMVISPNIKFYDTSAPLVFRYPRKRKIRSYKQFEKEYLEV